MKLTKFVMAAAILATFSAKANFNTDCKFAYRTASLDLLQDIEDLKNNAKTGLELGASVAATDLSVKTFRAACYASESAENRTCVLAYKEIYQEMKNRLSALALVLGNQDKADFGKIDSAATKIKIKWNDVKCDF